MCGSYSLARKIPALSWLVSSSGCFRRGAVHSGDAARRPAAPPRRARSPAAEPGEARVSLSSRRDAFWIGGSSQNKKRGFGEASFHRTRSRDRDTRAEWIQSPAPHRLAAKANGEIGREHV